MKRLLRDRRGGVAVLVAGAMPVLLGAAAFAVDVASMSLDARRLQGLADGAALAAAADPANAATVASKVVASAPWQRSIATSTVSGTYTAAAAIAPDARFTAGGTEPNAVRVTLRTTSPTYFARIFGQTGTTITRSATARQARYAAFSIGSRLASLSGGLVNAYLSALTGSQIALSAMDYEALAKADVDLFGYLDALRTRTRLTAASYDTLLAGDVSGETALLALADVLARDGSGAAGAVRSIAAAASGQTIALHTLIDPGPLGGSVTGGKGIGRVQSLALATALLQLAGGGRQVSFDAAAAVPGLAQTRISVAVGERPNASPWLAVGDRGVVIRTAQSRLLVESQANAAGVGMLRVPLLVELAGAEARLAGIDCGAARAVTVEARGNPGQAALAAVDIALLGDFKTPLTLRPARLLELPLVSVDGSSRIDLGASAPWQPLRFTRDEIAAGAVKSVATSTVTGGIAASLMTQARLEARVAGFGIAADPLLRTVGASLATVAPGLDTLIGLATGTLGVKVGEADVRVTGQRCDAAVLVS